MAPGPNGWNEWSRHVLAELERLNTCYERMNKQLFDLRTDFTALKAEYRTHARMAGFLSGLVASIIVGVITAVVVTYIASG